MSVKSTSKSTDLIYSNSEEAKRVIANFTQLSRKDVDTFMASVDYGLSLKLSMIISMNLEAQWMMDNGKIAKKTLPDFFKIVEEGPMKKLFPDKLTIIR